MQILRPNQREEWMAVLQRCPHDFYHLPGYHAHAEARGEGAARLFAHTEGEHVVALPLLFRPVWSAPGLASAPAGWTDATSVYGYPGPVASREDVPEAVVHRFHAALAEELHRLGVVTVFSRLHPLLPQTPLLAGLGSCRHTRRTVAVDLTLSPEVVRARYRKSHKMGINRLRRVGLSCRRDPDFASLDEFIAMYHETMRRVGASVDFFFPRSYFEGLIAQGGPHVHLFVAEQGEEAVCGGVFLECNGIIQYHLSGTRDSHLELAPSKMLVDTVRIWGQERGDRFLHLGGGFTSNPEDSLFQFKLGFSGDTWEFRTWQWVVNPDANALLVDRARQWRAESGLPPAPADFFPEYRAPTAVQQQQEQVA